jgi:hypothetical protein
VANRFAVRGCKPKQTNDRSDPVARANRHTTYPFFRGQSERPLRITYHTSTLTNLTTEEREALSLLYELSALPVIEALRTDPGALPHFEIQFSDEPCGLTNVEVRHYDHRRRQTHMPNPRELSGIGRRLSATEDVENSETKEILKNLLVARTHVALRQDILVTKSNWLLNNKKNIFIGGVNPHTPLDAAKLVGYSFGPVTYTHTACLASHRFALIVVSSIGC